LGAAGRQRILVKPDWAPDQGDLIWIQFDPQVGREQAGHRPAVVITQAVYNRSSGLALCVPLTSRAKGYPFEVTIGGDRPGVALVDHVKSLDWKRRHATAKGRITRGELEAIRAKLRKLIG
jgi:mRNA interferase MazF